MIPATLIRPGMEIRLTKAGPWVHVFDITETPSGITAQTSSGVHVLNRFFYKARSVQG